MRDADSRCDPGGRRVPGKVAGPAGEEPRRTVRGAEGRLVAVFCRGARPGRARPCPRRPAYRCCITGRNRLVAAQTREGCKTLRALHARAALCAHVAPGHAPVTFRKQPFLQPSKKGAPDGTNAPLSLPPFHAKVIDSAPTRAWNPEIVVVCSSSSMYMRFAGETLR